MNFINSINAKGEGTNPSPFSKNLKYILISLLSFLPFLFLLTTIFNFSQQTGTVSGGLSQKVSSYLVYHFLALFHLQKNPAEIASLISFFEYPIRKIAHISEYFLLNSTLLFPLLRILKKTPRTIYLSVSISLICASLDEFHQTFIPGRTGRPFDVFVDLIGIVISSILFCLLCRVKFFKKILSDQIVMIEKSGPE